jgi:hypothetical protein
MRNLGTERVAICGGLIMALAGFAGAASPREVVQLTNAQLDKVTAGASASGTGTGAAQGMLSSSEVTITTAVGLSGTGDVSAVGLVTSNASSSSAGIDATASSSLSLIVVSP